MSGGFDDGEDLDLVAGEYVLGTLDARERETFAERMKRDDATRRAVIAWDARLAGLCGRVDAITPPPDVWSRIERSLAGAGGATMHPFKVIPGGGHGPDASVIRRSRNRWRAGALLSGAVAAALLVALAGQAWRGLATAPDSSTYVAAVNRGGDKPALIVRVDLKTGKVMVRPVAATAPEGKSLELWYIGSDKTPRSMGLVDKDMSKLQLSGTVAENATFAVSVEPPGGSKTGGPTGPVVYAGQLVKE